MPDAETKSLPPGTIRLLPVDALRGLIIAFMALDHANHFVAQKHSSGEMWGSPFPTYTDETPKMMLHLLSAFHRGRWWQQKGKHHGQS